ncbi:hypothetical protein ERO13_A11G316968v2 [Gossypium hirsutum]|nr:hypothetical protein ERO13_A11G316968v2 [Gossypium hirsutum]
MERPMKLARCPSKWLYYMLCKPLETSLGKDICQLQQFICIKRGSQRTLMWRRLRKACMLPFNTMMMVMPYVWPFCKTCTGISQWLCG